MMIKEMDVSKIESPRHGGQGQGACVPWGLPHPFTGRVTPLGGRAPQVRFRGVVGAEPLDRHIVEKSCRTWHG